MPPKRSQAIYKTSAGSLNVPGAQVHPHRRIRASAAETSSSASSSYSSSPRPIPLPLHLYTPRDISSEAAEFENDRSAVARSLAIDFPLIDESLLLSLLSDFTNLQELNQGLADVRETLGILEAGFVADQEEEQEQEVWKGKRNGERSRLQNEDEDADAETGAGAIDPDQKEDQEDSRMDISRWGLKPAIGESRIQESTQRGSNGGSDELSSKLDDSSFDGNGNTNPLSRKNQAQLARKAAKKMRTTALDLKSTGANTGTSTSDGNVNVNGKSKPKDQLTIATNENNPEDHVTAWMAKLATHDANDDTNDGTRTRDVPRGDVPRRGQADASPSRPSTSRSTSMSASSKSKDDQSAVRVADFAYEDHSHVVNNFQRKKPRVGPKDLASGSQFTQTSKTIPSSTLTSTSASAPSSNSRSTASTPDTASEASGPEFQSLASEGFAYGFLVEMFPTLPLDVIQDHLQEAGIALDEEEADLTFVIETLLSVELLRDVEERGDWPDEENLASFLSGPLPQPFSNPRNKRQTEKEIIGTVKIQPRNPPTIPKPDLLGPKPVDRPLSLSIPRYADVKRQLGDQTSRESIGKKSSIRTLRATASDGYLTSDTDSVASEKSYNVKKVRKDLPGVATSYAKEIKGARKLKSSESDGTLAKGWQRLQSMAQFLSDIIPSAQATESYFLSYFHTEGKQSLHGALRSALIPLMVPESQVEKELAALKDVLVAPAGDDWSDEFYALSIRATKGNMSNAIDLFALLKELSETDADRDMWAVMEPSNEREPDDRASRQAAAQAAFRTEFEGQMDDFPVTTSGSKRIIKPIRKGEHVQNWKKIQKPGRKEYTSDHPLAAFIPSYARGETPNIPIRGSLFHDFNSTAPTGDYDLAICRQQAAELRQKRESAMMQAGRYFKAKAPSGMGAAAGRQVAAFYASEARRYENNARIWEIRAARQVVKAQRYVEFSSSRTPLPTHCANIAINVSDGPFSIDIHHLTVAEASVVVRESVEAWHAGQNHGKEILAKMLSIWPPADPHATFTYSLVACQTFPGHHWSWQALCESCGYPFTRHLQYARARWLEGGSWICRERLSDSSRSERLIQHRRLLFTFIAICCSLAFVFVLYLVMYASMTFTTFMPHRPTIIRREVKIDKSLDVVVK